MPAVLRVLLLRLSEERPAFKDHREKFGQTEGKSGALSGGRAAGPRTSRTQKQRGAWGRASSGSCAETWVPGPMSCTWHAEHGPKEAGPRVSLTPTALQHTWWAGLRPSRQVQLLSLPLTTYLCGSISPSAKTVVPTSQQW